jgi:predicted AAA+ superfamily ATPase
MLARHLQPLVAESLANSPAVLLLGPRQVGKSTLVQAIAGAADARYLTLDDPAVLDAARRDPDALVGGGRGLQVFDEVQRAPDLLRAVKLAVDRDRRPGRFLLTGSTNVSTLRSVAETLAGRIAVHTLHPFSWSEMRRQPPSPALELAFAAADAQELVAGLRRRGHADRATVGARLLAGGMPVPALMEPGRQRSLWYASYLDTYVQRDLLEAASLQQLPEFHRLLTTLALRTSRLCNFAELSRDLAIPATTLRRLFDVLQQTYQVRTLAPFLPNVEKRLVKTPRVYLQDTGIACHLAGIDDLGELERQQRVGAMFETFVEGELRRMVEMSPRRTLLHFYRSHAGREVDFVALRGESAVAVEVKWSSTVDDDALAGIAELEEMLGRRLKMGVVVYMGRECLALGKRRAAVPVAAFV